MLEFFNVQKPKIERFLREFFNSKEKSLSGINEWGGDIQERLIDFTVSGKMIRGGLVLLSHSLFSGRRTDSALRAAAAMELFQSGFLIHDDIMDRDLLRRGKESLFYQYKVLGDRKGFNDSYHFGESMGICAGDIAFFLSFEILSGLNGGAAAEMNINKLVSAEFVSVGLAQMQDVFFSNIKDSPDEASILNLYTYKTGRYTFSLPLMTGAILADTDRAALGLLSDIGEDLGLIFQIKDDEIGLFGNERETGKPVGSDLKENKKNLYHYYLLRDSGPMERERLLKIFGSGRISDKDIDYIREQILRIGVDKIINRKMTELRKCAGDLIGDIKNADPSGIAVLRELLDYSIERKS